MNTVRKYSKRQQFTLSGVLLLLAVYLTGVIQPELHRELSHVHDNTTLHSAEAEQDGCHRNIFHQQKDACKHKTHATPFSKCLVCQSSVHADHDIRLSEAAVAVVLHQTHFVTADFVVISRTLAKAGSRAPPVF